MDDYPELAPLEMYTWEESMRIFLSNATNSLNYYASGNLISKGGFLHHRRAFELYVLIMVKEGVLYISQSGVNYQVGKNQYILLSSKEEHFGYQESSDQLSYLWVHFSFDMPVTIYPEATFVNDQLENIVSDCNQSYYIIPEYGEISLTQRAPLLFNQLLELSRNENLYFTQSIDYALSLLVMEISQEYIEVNYNIKNNIPPKIAKVMEWIKENYYRDITIKEIAKEFGYNQDYLASVFRKATGCTIIQYINNTRINIAKSLITNYDVSIKEAAYTCGFMDEKYFMKIFKRMEGMTPSQYKNAFSNFGNPTTQET